jgi:hypothetical protein
VTSAERIEPTRVASWERAIYALLLAWFAARVGYLALTLHPYVPPDEITHIGRVLAYAKVWGVPDNGPASFDLGLLDHRPWLYYWVMARAVALNWLPVPDLIFARLVNGVLGLATVWVGILWVREWCRSVWARLLFGVLITNTLMFTGLAASVSYDNGANLLAAGALLALTKFRKRPSIGWLLAFGAMVLAGCLAKRTFLPLGFLLVLLLLVRERNHLNQPGTLVRDAAEGFRSAGVGSFALLGTVIVLAGFTLGLYGGNLLQYGKLRPGFDQIVGEENAMANRVFARSRIIEEFQTGVISIDEARERAGQIRHKGDRGDTLFLLKSAQLPESSVIGRVPYVSAWGYGILKSSVGYLGHRRAVKSSNALIGYALVFGIAALLLLRRWRRGDAYGVPADAAFLVLGYAFVLMWFVHYPTYQTSRYIELALQGRYMFPVLVPVYGLVAWSLGELAPERARPWFVGATAAFYLYGDLPWLLGQIDEKWYMPG